GMGCAGLPVDAAREKVRETLIASGDAARYYELTGAVRSRWLTNCTVKIVEDQWFLKYGDTEWTARTREALDTMTLFPRKARAQFEYVLGWLRDWACAREQGLGTRLPWDEKWVIESLSDSTIYMAYYTVAHHVNSLPAGKLGEELFEALFGDGDPGAVPGHDAKQIAAWRAEFEYWYPYDLRVSGKDLIQNHLSFSLFNHTAVFPPEKWPRAFAVNGWVLVDGEKMSKSRGNFYTIRQLIDRYGADATRLTLCNSGEGLDDPNWEGSFADSAGRKLDRWLRFVRDNAGSGRDEPHPVDDWFAAMLSQAAHDARRACDRMRFRTAMRGLFFELPRHYRWYLRRCVKPRRDLLHDYLSTVTRGLAPVVPHLAEEAWEILGGDGFASDALYPDGEPALEELLRGEELVQRTHADIEAILKVARIASPQAITLLITPGWKWQAVALASGLADERGRVDMQSLMKAAMATLPAAAKQEAAAFLKQWALKEIPSLGPGWAARYAERLDEAAVLEQASDFLAATFGCEVAVAAAGDAIGGAADKARQAAPLRPAIFVK
ncbi:MAG: class I tRNA ligase family protein, partial [Candidatus Poseidoniia archaeon]|nr:class I tRNA ligase family protein [Candidatus Poseidoniia archaeon]